LQTPYILIRLFPATSETFAKLFSLHKSPGASPPHGKRQSSNTTGMRTLRKTGNLRVVPNILGHPRGLIYIPLAPSFAFYASPDPNKGRQLRAQKPNSVVKEMNRWQAALAARFIYAADTEHTAFVEKRLRTA
jgi:hypothetical protein